MDNLAPPHGALTMDLCTVLEAGEYLAADDSDFIEDVACRLWAFGWRHKFDRLSGPEFTHYVAMQDEVETLRAALTLSLRAHRGFASRIEALQVGNAALTGSAPTFTPGRMNTRHRRAIIERAKARAKGEEPA